MSKAANSERNRKQQQKLDEFGYLQSFLKIEQLS